MTCEFQRAASVTDTVLGIAVRASAKHFVVDSVEPVTRQQSHELRFTMQCHFAYSNTGFSSGKPVFRHSTDQVKADGTSRCDDHLKRVIESREPKKWQK